jgi:hypothetical protein
MLPLALRMLNDEMSFHLLLDEIRNEDTPNTLFLSFFKGKGDGKFYFEGALPGEGGNPINAS